MKHLIVMNKKAGKEKDSAAFEEAVKKAFEGLDYEIYVTTGPRSVVSYLKDYLSKTEDTVRVYACGGDGTVHEVVNGIVGHDNAELAIYASGTGNDFVKSYAKTKSYDEIVTGKAGEKRFQDFAALINGKVTPIDVSKITGGQLSEPWYSVNVINFGFDAIVGARGNYYKEHGVPADAKEKEKDPYKYALNHDAMKHGRFNDTEVYADGEKLNDKQILLSTIAQGQFVGGSFWCAPKSDNTDGFMDVCVLKTMTFLGLGMIIGTYTKGKHLDKKRKKIVYRRAKKVTIVAPQDIDVCIDGEMVRGSKFEVECIPGAVKFVLPE